MEIFSFKMSDYYEDLKIAEVTAYLNTNSKEIDLSRSYPAIVICPGGGYGMTSDREAEPVALMYLAKGFNVFVLRYSVIENGGEGYPLPLLEVAGLIKTVRQNATKWHIDPNKIAVTGFSA